MGHMHGGGNFTVDGARLDLSIMPQLLCVFRSPAQPALYAVGLAVFQQSQFRHLVSQIIDILSFCLHTPFPGNADQFLRVFYFVISIRRHMSQRMTDLTAVVGMGGCSAGYEPQEISSGDTMSVTSADSSWRFRRDTARSHGTDPAADSLLSEFTVGGLVFYTKLPGIRPYFRSRFQESFCGCFKFFD